MTEYEDATGGAELLEDVAAWFRRFIYTVADADHDLLALFTVHTHLAEECYTTPRIQLDSPMPGSGKTTVLDHLTRLCRNALTMASVSSPALLVRMIDAEPTTILIDEADRSLDPDKDGVKDLLAVLNSGYRRGSTRPVLVPVKGGGWEASKMSTFAPVVIAGNNPNLPDDTRLRMIRVLLLPDLDGQAEESDWEEIEEDARELADRIAAWADEIRDAVRGHKPEMPEGIIGRFREKWGPLARVADLARGRWPQSVRDMALQDKEQFEMDKDDGLIRERPAILLLKHLYDVWPSEKKFIPTTDLIDLLVLRYPGSWGSDGPFGKALTSQRMGRMLVTAFKVNSSREYNSGPRGYYRAALANVWGRMKVDRPLPETDETGSTGSTPAIGAGSAGSAGLTGSAETPLPEPETLDFPPPAACAACGRASSFQLIDGLCRRCLGNARAAS